MRATTLPRVISAALSAPDPKCYRHCDRRAPPRALPGPLPGQWRVYACPSGVVSVASYAEWTNRDPTRRVLSFLRRSAVPSSLVRPTDLRLATRHGPEMGAAAEQRLAARRPHRDVRVVYWRIYPFKAPDGTEHRLFICRRKNHSRPVFYSAPGEPGETACPVCARRRTVAGRRRTPA